jgi:hypothetical protein
MRIRTLYAFVELTSRQSPRPLRLPSHRAGNRTSLAKIIRAKVKNGFRNFLFFVPSFAKNRAIQDCVTHNAGVIWRLSTFWNPASVNKRFRASVEKCEI